MPENRSRFVLLCQQTLAFGLVAAVAAPAANLVTLEIVSPPHPDGSVVGRSAGGTTGQPAGQPAGRPAGQAAARTALVATRAVRPRVRAVPLVGVSGAGLRALRTDSGSAGTSPDAARLTSATTGAASDSTRLAALSAPQRVGGLATVGVTWRHGVQVADTAISLTVRTQRHGTWSRWTRLPYHQDEGPDPTSREGRRAEPGTDPVYVGAVDDVQVQARTRSGTAPAGMRLAMVDPGVAASRAEAPAIDTGRQRPPATGSTTGSTAGSTTGSTAGGDQAALSAARVTSRPRIFSRAQWGADERMRDRSSLHYGEVHGGFVHHTVNANSYRPDQVPSVIRGIYAYHTQSRGWSDIGYNFLVDRFGRIWEGRHGGVGRPVVGAHTLGYNDDAFAMSAIGNYDITRPSAATVRAFGRLFAWKLSLHGVRASSTRQWVERRYLPAINGHRDVGQTACPGRYLYARIPAIRALAASYQRSFAARGRLTRVAGSVRPVVLARDRTSRRLFLIATHPNGTAGRVRGTGVSLPGVNLVLNAGDWDGDGKGDVIARSAATGRLELLRGGVRSRLRAPVQLSRKSFARVRLLASVGDLTGDGRPDLLGQPRGGAMRLYPGNGMAGFHGSFVAHAAINAVSQLGVGLYDGDGSPDSILRARNGTLVLYPGNGPGGLTGGRTVGSVGRIYDRVVAVGDVNRDGWPDLVGRARATGRMWLLPGSARGFAARHSFLRRTGRFDLFG